MASSIRLWVVINGTRGYDKKVFPYKSNTPTDPGAIVALLRLRFSLIFGERKDNIHVRAR